MPNIPSVTSKRLLANVPKFIKVVEQARERDVNESDTVTIVTDILEEVFGFNKYTEITREYAIGGTYCDLAIKTSKKVEYLIEVKAIGIALKDSHIRQAVNYAAKEGIRWVVLTNGIQWQIHRVKVEGKVENTILMDFDFTALNPRKTEDQETLLVLCKRGVQKDLINEMYEHRQSVNRYRVGAVILTDPIISTIARELRKIREGLKVGNEQIEDLIRHEVLKRDLIDSDAAKEAQKTVQKVLKKRLRLKSKPTKTTGTELEVTENVLSPLVQ